MQMHLQLVKKYKRTCSMQTTVQIAGFYGRTKAKRIQNH